MPFTVGRGFSVQSSISVVNLSELANNQWGTLLRQPERWLTALNVVLTACAGLLLAQFVWLFIPLPDQPPLPPPAASAGPEGPGGTVNIADVVSLPLFGVRSVKSADAVPLEAPDTHLNLTLTGILAASNPMLARALIKDATGKQRSYGVDDDVPGGARISAIHTDRVIMLRNGRYETLRLESNKTPGAPSASAQRIAPPSGLSADAVAKLKQARQDIVANPAKASDYVRIQPVYNNGKLKGYRIYPGRQRELFTQAGLQPGELVTSVNGVTLDDPARGLQMLGDLAQAGSFNLTLENSNGQTRTVNINMN